MQKMRGYRFFLTLLIIVISFVDYGLIFSQKISYHLEINEIDWDSFHIRVTAQDVSLNRLLFTIPCWRPGEYMHGNFGQHVSNFQAHDAYAQPLPVSRLNVNTWSVESGDASSVRVEYDVDHSEPDILGISVDSSFALIDGAKNFMFIDNLQHLPAKVDFQVPHGWKVATALPPTESSFEYRALNYDHLIDCPVLMSDFKEFYFTLRNRPFYVIFNNTSGIDVNNMLIMIKRIVYYQSRLFDEIPFNNYFFLIYIDQQGNGGWGLEHRNSTYLHFTKKLMQKNLRLAANVVAHEFFHVWNIKRFYPSIFENSDYCTEAHSANLWFSEGVTSYYADLTLLRAQIWSEQEFLRNQERMIEELQQNADRLNTSAEEASRNVWENGYFSEGISYYTKGQLLGLLLDLTMRQQTDNAKSLDDLMRFMNWWFGKYNTGFEEGDILRALNAISNNDFTEFYERYVRGTMELPYEEILAYAGISCIIEKDTIPGLGRAHLSVAQNKVIVLDDDGPLAAAGLKIGDKLKSINGTPVNNEDDISAIESLLKPNEEVKIEAEREGLPMILYARVGLREKIKATLGFMEDASERQMKIRRGWLTGTSNN